MKAKWTLILPALLAAGLLMPASAGNPDAVLGTWMVEAKDGKVEIYKCGARYCGKLAWLKNPNDRDTKNPTPARRNDKLLGKVILQNFRYDGEKWVKGRIYDPNDGETYCCLMWLDGPNRLYVKGYIGISLIGRKELWSRTR